MSSRLLLESYKAPITEISGPALAVYRWLAWRLNAQTGRCDPSHADISAGTGFGISTVKRALADLQERGLVSWKTNAGGAGRGRDSNFYDLEVNTDSWSGDDQKSKSARPRVQIDTTKSPERARNNSKRTTTRKKHTQQRACTRKKKGTAPSPPAAVASRKKTAGVADAERTLAGSIVAAFNEVFGTALTVEPHLTPIVGRIREKPELEAEHHRMVIEAVFAGEHWWTGAPSPRIIYGNAAQFDQSMEMARAAARRPPILDINAEAARIRKAQEEGLD